MSFQGINQNINQKLGPFNNWTGQHDDACAYYNRQKMSTNLLNITLTMFGTTMKERKELNNTQLLDTKKILMSMKCQF